MKNISQFLSKPEGKFIGLIALLIVLLLGYYFYAVGTGKVANVKQVVISETDHVRGAQSGSVTLVEFGDFQCPACAAYEPLVRKVTEDNPQILKVVFRHFPLTQIHKNALLAAKATEAAAIQGKFWEMHDILYDKQQEWSGQLNARDTFIAYAKLLSLDVKKFETDLENKSIEDKILAEYREGVSLGVQGTPTFFVNGKMIESPGSIEEFDKIIKDAAK
jgi:protein-disulfide isomerase